MKPSNHLRNRAKRVARTELEKHSNYQHLPRKRKKEARNAMREAFVIMTFVVRFHRPPQFERGGPKDLEFGTQWENTDKGLD